MWSSDPVSGVRTHSAMSGKCNVNALDGLPLASPSENKLIKGRRNEIAAAVNSASNMNPSPTKHTLTHLSSFKRKRELLSSLSV